MVYPIDNPFDGRGGEVAAGRPAMPEEPPREVVITGLSWAAMLPTLVTIAGARDGEAKRFGIAELQRMARAADAAGKMLDTLRAVLTWFEASSVPRAYSADIVEAVRATVREAEVA